MWGWGLYGVVFVLCTFLRVQMWMCHQSYVKEWALLGEYSSTVLIWCGVSSSLATDLNSVGSLNASCRIDTELLSQRLAEYQHCVPECMHGVAASALSYVFAVKV